MAGIGWPEQCPDLTIDPALSDPSPLAVLDEDGQIYVWQFSRGIGAEDYVVPFGSVAPGSLIVQYPLDRVSALWALEPAGTQAILADSNCNDTTSASLLAQRWSSVASSSVSSFPKYKDVIGSVTVPFTADDYLYVRY